MSQRVVSVVVPFLNTPPVFFREAIQSVLDQTYASWELTLVDDGSRGEAVEVAEDFAARHPERIRAVAHPNRANRGPSASRNLGLELSRGTYVAFLDADDLWLPSKLTEQVALLEEHPRAGTVYGPTRYWYSWSPHATAADRDFEPELGFPADTLLEPPELLVRFLSGSASVPCMGSLLTRLDLVRGFGGFESSFRGLYEDQLFYAKLALAAPVFASGSCWDWYRQHPHSSTSATSFQAERQNRGAFLDWLEGYVDRVGLDGTALTPVLRRERWKLRHPKLARVLRTSRRMGRQLQRLITPAGRS